MPLTHRHTCLFVKKISFVYLSHVSTHQTATSSPTSSSPLKYNIAGFAGDDAPRSVFPSLIGRARQPGIMVRFMIIKIYALI